MVRILQQTFIYLLIRLLLTVLFYIVFSIVKGTFLINHWSPIERILFVIVFLINLFTAMPKVFALFKHLLEMRTQDIKEYKNFNDFERNIQEIQLLAQQKIRSGELTRKNVRTFIEEEFTKRGLQEHIKDIKIMNQEETEQVKMSETQKVLVNKSDHYILNDLEIKDSIDHGIYLLQDGTFGPSLKKVRKFEFPEVMYSNDDLFIKHVLKTFEISDENLGVLLTGKKGLGKSVTAKRICTKSKLPVIMINNHITVKELMFLNNLTFSHALYIDEFDKIFDANKKNNSNLDNIGLVTQESFLSFLDGSNTNNVKRLFIVTTNSNVNSFLINRPSRLRYVKKYDEIDAEIVNEIINKKLEDKSFAEDLIENLSNSGLNIDILNKICDEINLHKMPYSSFRDFFNFEPESVNYIYSLIPDGFKAFPISYVNFVNNAIHNKKLRERKLLDNSFYDLPKSKEADLFVTSTFDEYKDEIIESGGADVVIASLSDDMNHKNRFIEIPNGLMVACNIELRYEASEGKRVTKIVPGYLKVEKYIEKIAYVM